ncbi:MAG TPA: toll/interleukin-1 receptor domain-containing protein [Rhodocyclaceae bacterium]|nr:toll/interleukin-1 receptor domain-containing protein [Rhodocyclaceae bacterium]
MSHVFLSYANEDREAARRIVGLLESADWRVWWDRRIPAGKNWAQVLDDALQGMCCMVVLWSRHSVDSSWVYEEAEEGRKRQILLPVLIDAVQPPRGFRGIQVADLSVWDGDTDAPVARQLLADLYSLVPRDEVPDRSLPPQPQPPPPTKDQDGPYRRLWPLITALALLLLVAAVWGLWPKPSTVGIEARVPAAPTDDASAAVQAGSAVTEHSQAASSGTVMVKKPEHGVAQAGSTKSVGTRAAPRPTLADEPMCSALQERVSIGETLNDSDRRLLEKVCR